MSLIDKESFEMHCLLMKDKTTSEEDEKVRTFFRWKKPQKPKRKFDVEYIINCINDLEKAKTFLKHTDNIDCIIDLVNDYAESFETSADEEMKDVECFENEFLKEQFFILKREMECRKFNTEVKK